MATPDDETTWISTTGIWPQATSWSNGIPNSGIQPKTAKFDGTSNHDVIAVSSGTMQRLVTKPEYTGNIGSAGDPFELIAQAFSILRGRGEHHLLYDPGDFGTVILDTEPGKQNTIDGSVARCAVKRGWLDIKRTCDLSVQLFVCGREAKVYVPAEAASELAPTLIVVTAGELEFWRTLPANSVVVLLGGRVTWRGVLSDDTVLVKGPGGVWIYDPVTEPVSDPKIIFAQGRTDLTELDWPFGVNQAIIGPTAELDGGTLTAFGPTTAFTDVIDLRLDYP